MPERGQAIMVPVVGRWWFLAEMKYYHLGTCLAGGDWGNATGGPTGRTEGAMCKVRTRVRVGIHPNLR